MELCFLEACESLLQSASFGGFISWNLAVIIIDGWNRWKSMKAGGRSR